MDSLLPSGDNGYKRILYIHVTRVVSAPAATAVWYCRRMTRGDNVC